MHRDDQAILFALFPTLVEKIEESRERRREYAKLCHISVATHQALRSDRWFPDWQSKDRAWLAAGS